jgi:hypothetical protein
VPLTAVGTSVIISDFLCQQFAYNFLGYGYKLTLNIRRKYHYAEFGVFTAGTIKNVVFWDVARVALVKTDVSRAISKRQTFVLIRVYSFYPEDGGDTFLRNVGF